MAKKRNDSEKTPKSFDLDSDMSLDLDESFSLESIIAEYKPKAPVAAPSVQDYINRTNVIIREKPKAPEIPEGLARQAAAAKPSLFAAETRPMPPKPVEKPVEKPELKPEAAKPEAVKPETKPEAKEPDEAPKRSTEKRPWANVDMPKIPDTPEKPKAQPFQDNLGDRKPFRERRGKLFDDKDDDLADLFKEFGFDDKQKLDDTKAADFVDTLIAQRPKVEIREVPMSKPGELKRRPAEKQAFDFDLPPEEGTKAPAESAPRTRPVQSGGEKRVKPTQPEKPRAPRETYAKKKKKGGFFASAISYLSGSEEFEERKSEGRDDTDASAPKRSGGTIIPMPVKKNAPERPERLERPKGRSVEEDVREFFELWEEQEDKPQESFFDDTEAEAAPAVDTEEAPAVSEETSEDDIDSPFVEAYVRPERPEQTEAENEESDTAEDGTFAQPEYDDYVKPPELAAPVVLGDNDDGEEEPYDEPKRRGILGFFNGSSDDEYDDDEYDDYDDEEEDTDPNLNEKAAELGKGLKSLSLRSIIACAIAVVMAVFTIVFEHSGKMAFGIDSFVGAASVLAVMQLVVMALAIDVFSDGIWDLVTGKPGIETVASFSLIFTLGDMIFCLLAGLSTERGLPFFAPAAFSIVMAMRSKYQYLSAVRSALRTPAAVANPGTVVPVDVCSDDRVVLRRVRGSLSGFYRGVVSADLTEMLYSYAAPILLIMSLVFAGITAISRNAAENVLYALSAFLAVSASFSGMVAFTKPFHSISQRLRKIGVAIAGWSGAVVMDESDGTLVTDEDVFPAGTASVSGIKLFDGMSFEKAAILTSSLIIASGSSLTKAFEDLLGSRGLRVEKVEDFACFDGGGLSGNVRGLEIYVGSSGFMNLMGIRVPETANAKNALFMAVNKRLACVASIEYLPTNSVQSALVSLMKAGVNMLFAMRDFNITPLMLKQKFKVSLDDIEYVPAEVCYSVTDESLPDSVDTVAVLCREGLGQMADAVTSSRMLVNLCKMNTLLSLFSTAVGIIFLLVICGTGAFGSLTATSVLVYNFVILAVTTVISAIAARKK